MTSPAPLRKNRPDWWVTPCRTCGEAGDNFDLRRDDRAPYGLVRFCLPCHGSQAYAWAANNPEAARESKRRYAQRVSTEPCLFEGCDRFRRGRYCDGHAKQLVRAKGDETKLRPLGRYAGLPGQRSP